MHARANDPSRVEAHTRISLARACGGDAQALYADSYTLSGCHDDNRCGVFTLVVAHCATRSGAHCSGGASTAGNTDLTLCDGAPVYEKVENGRRTGVLLRLSEGGGTRWYVSHVSKDPESEISCSADTTSIYTPRGDLNPGRPGYAPTAPAYGQMSTPEWHESISVVVGGGR